MKLKIVEYKKGKFKLEDGSWVETTGPSFLMKEMIGKDIDDVHLGWIKSEDSG